MLNVPESVKTLYKTDGVRKNFRVHFPNGEMEDITNDNIVRESLHFTESVCSQSVFRFGLAEASVIEFETVGVGNMFGMTIECSIEIDTTSLSSAEISAIQSGTWDGSLVLASASDIGFGFFRIPLGLFRVDKCPRNHGAMTHRQVTAYSVGLAENSITSSFERWKQQAFFSVDHLDYDIQKFIDANVYSNDAEAVASKYSQTLASYSTSQPFANPFANIKTADGGYIDFRPYSIGGSGWNFRAYNSSINPLRLFSVEDLPVYDTTQIIEYITNYLTEWGLAEYIPKVIGEAKKFFDPTISCQYNSGEAAGANFDRFFTIKSDMPIAYIPDNVNMTLCFPIAGTFDMVYANNQGVITKEAPGISCTFANSFPSVYRLSGEASKTMRIEASNAGISSDGKTRWNYKVAYSVNDIVRGWLELTGEFGTENRGRGFEQFALSPNNPVVINPGNYDEAWWDEYDVDAIGTVSLTFKNGDEEVTASVFLGNGSSVYDMTDNEALKMLDGLTLDGIVELLNGEFAQNAEEVGFTPTEITMQGWPWIEAGDALRITAEDGTVVNTYALRVEFSGIQNMMSDIISEGGEIVGEV